MPNMEEILPEATASTFFVEADLVHRHFQIILDPHDARIHIFRGADPHSLFEPTRTLRGLKNSGIHTQVHTTKLFDEIQKNSSLWISD